MNLKAGDTLVTIVGKVLQDRPIGFSDLLVVNTSTGQGVWGKPDGSFKITIGKNDTIKISSRGFTSGIVTVKDSTYKPIYHVTVTLKLLEVRINRPIIIRPKPTLEELAQTKEQIGQLRYDPWVMTEEPSISSPISMFYYLFSKKEKEKREYLELVREQQYEQALKKIIHFYIDSGLFYLDEDEIEKFMAQCQLNREFIKYGSVYEIGEAVYDCYKEYAKRQGY